MEPNYRYRQPELQSRDQIDRSDTFFEGDVETRSNIKLTNCAARKVYSTQGSVEAQNSRFNEVESRNNIFLTNAVASRVYSSQGEITWRNNSCSTLSSSIESRNSIDLNNVSAREVKSNQGSISWKNDSLTYHSGTVESRNNIVLNNVSADSVLSNQGGIQWSNTKKSDQPVRKIEARNHIVLRGVNCVGQTESNQGEVQVFDSNLNSVAARNGITIENTVLKTIRSFQGTFQAINSTTEMMEARNNITLINTTGQSCVSNQGSVTIVSDKKLTYQQIEARNQVVISNIDVTHFVKCTQGEIRATNCQLPNIACRENFALIQSRILNAEVSVGNKKKAVIELDTGTIDGDIIIDYSKMIGSQGNYVSSMSSEGDLFSFAGNITSEFLRSKKFLEGSKGEINGIPHIYTNGEFKPVNPTAVNEKDWVEVEIKGSGIFKGKVIFKNCEGEVKISDNIKH